MSSLKEKSIPTAGLYHEIVQSPFGDAAILWSEGGQGPRIIRVLLPIFEEGTLTEILGMAPGAVRKSCEAVAKLADGLQAFMKGKAVSFDTAPLAMNRVPSFHRKVLCVLARIPRGRVSTYAAVAARAGSLSGARAAGQGCAKNPFPILFPCHRVIRSDGFLGGFGGGLPLKKAFLELEGVTFDARGKVDKTCFL